jgi:hypothetical protein
MEKALSKTVASLCQKLETGGQEAIEGALIPYWRVSHQPGAVAGFCYLLDVFRRVPDKADVEG